MNNQATKYLFTKLVNDKKYICLPTKVTNIKKISTIYGNCYKTINSYEEFLKKLGSDLSKELCKSKSAVSEIKKQLVKRLGLQPCILDECFISEGIAQLLELTNYADADSASTVPISVANTTFKFKGQRDASFRYIYWNDNCDTILYQCGGSGEIDAVFTKYNVSVRIEYKSGLSRIGEKDITGGYDDNGKLTPDEKFINNNPVFYEIIKEFNKRTSIFEIAGKNYCIDNLLSDDLKAKLFNNEIKSNNSDLYIFICEDKFLPILSGFFLDNVSLQGSEIRSSGKNPSSKRNECYIDTVLTSLNATYSGDKVILDYDKDNLVKARGSNIITRYAIGKLMFVRIKDCTIDNNKISFNKQSITQKTPNISIHAKPFFNNDSIDKQIKLLNEM